MESWQFGLLVGGFLATVYAFTFAVGITVAWVTRWVTRMLAKHFGVKYEEN